MDIDINQIRKLKELKKELPREKVEKPGIKKIQYDERQKILVVRQDGRCRKYLNISQKAARKIVGV